MPRLTRETPQGRTEVGAVGEAGAVSPRRVPMLLLLSLPQYATGIPVYLSGAKWQWEEQDSNL